MSVVYTPWQTPPPPPLSCFSSIMLALLLLLHASHMGLLPVLLICLETPSQPFAGKALPSLPFSAQKVLSPPVLSSHRSNIGYRPFSTIYLSSIDWSEVQPGVFLEQIHPTSLCQGKTLTYCAWPSDPSHCTNGPWRSQKTQVLVSTLTRSFKS